MSLFFEKPFTFDRVARIVLLSLLAFILFMLLVVLRDALLPFLLAWLMAYMAQPFVKFFQYKLGVKSRLLSVILLFITTGIALWLASIMIVPSIVEEVNKTIHFVKNFQGLKPISYFPESWLIYFQEFLTGDTLKGILNFENIQSITTNIGSRVWQMISGTFSVLLSITIVFVILLYFFFILLDYERVMNGWINLIPAKQRPFIKELFEDVEKNMNRYFRGQSLVALCVGILLAIGFRIIDFPLAVILGLFIGLLNLIPYMQIVGIVPMLLLSLLKSAETDSNFWVIFGSALLVLLIVQLIQDFLLMPKIMGKAMGLNPVVILLSLSIWGTLLGFVGLIIALPLTTLCLAYYNRYILEKKE